MEPVANKQTKIIFTIFLLLVFISLGLTYYRYMIKRDFNIVLEN